MEKILIDPHNCHEVEYNDLFEYLDLEGWDFRAINNGADEKLTACLSILEEITPQIQEYSEELYNELQKAIIILK